MPEQSSKMEAKIKHAEKDLSRFFKRRATGDTIVKVGDIRKVIELWNLYYNSRGISAVPAHVMQFITDISVEPVKAWLLSSILSIEDDSGDTLQHLTPVLADFAITDLMYTYWDRPASEEVEIHIRRVSFELPEPTTTNHPNDQTNADAKNVSKGADLQNSESTPSSGPALKKRKLAAVTKDSNTTAPGSSFHGLRGIYDKMDALEAKMDAHFNQLESSEEDDTPTAPDLRKELDDIRKSLRRNEKSMAKMLDLLQVLKG